MPDRIVELSDGPAYLRVENRQLVVERKEKPARSMPIEEIGVLVMASGSVTATQAVLVLLAETGGSAVVCDGRSLPIGMYLPLHGNQLHCERMRQQVASALPVRKRLWAQIVAAKIRSQGAVLEDLRGDDGGLAALVRGVKSGDTGNAEAQAARRYWPLLFGDPAFRRQPQGGAPPNPLLDYGYAVLRAICARAVVASGLSAAIGLHHHNRSNPYCLADDLMEPFRPLIDRQVARIVEQTGPETALTRETKALLLSPLQGRLLLADEWRTLFDVVARLAADLAGVFAGEKEKLTLPRDFTTLQPA